MRTRMARVVCGLAMAVALAVPAAAAPLLTLNPVDGHVTGAPGETVGWGFTLENDTDYLVVTSATLQPDPWSAVGTFTDFIAQHNFVVVGPAPESSSVSQVFDAAQLTGIGSFAIDPGAAAGTYAFTIVLTYDLFSVSRNDVAFDPDTHTLNPTSNLLWASASVTVTEAQVPEPGTLALLAGGLAALAARRRAHASRC